MQPFQQASVGRLRYRLFLRAWSEGLLTAREDSRLQRCERFTAHIYQPTLSKCFGMIYQIDFIPGTSLLQVCLVIYTAAASAVPNI